MKSTSTRKSLPRLAVTPYCALSNTTSAGRKRTYMVMACSLERVTPTTSNLLLVMEEARPGGLGAGLKIRRFAGLTLST